MNNLSPTLFIGLGTTGMRIMRYLQQFILEEYGTVNLPIFQFLSLETDSGASVPPSLRFKPLLIGDIETVRNEITAENRRGNPSQRVAGYNDWLPPDVLNRGNRAITSGAGGTRAIGRLLLWENWDRVFESITDSYAQCTDPANELTVKRFLEGRSANEGSSPGSRKDGHGEADIQNGNRHTVYILGTLCGGSCSGMFADLGFMLHGISTNINRVGIFTVLNHQSASLQRKAMPAANCHGALKELDFFYQKTTAGALEYNLPKNKANTKEGPYDLLYLLSDTNANDTMLEEDGLNQMIAMSLFLDVVGGGRAAKEAALADMQQFMSDRPQNDDGFVKQFNSFGLSTVWYPKAKISGIAACDFADEMINTWLGVSDNASLAASTTIKPGQINAKNPTAMAEEDWQLLTRRIDSELGKGESDMSQTSTEMETIVNGAAKNVINQIKMDLRPVFEGGLTPILQQKINQVDRRLEYTRTYAKNELRTTILRALFNNFRDCAKMDEYLTEIRRQIENEQKTLPPNATNLPDYQPLNQIRSHIRLVQRNPWVTAVGMHRKAMRNQREAYKNAFLGLWLNTLSAYQRWRKRDIVLQTLLDDFAAIGTAVHDVRELIKAAQDGVKRRRAEFQKFGSSKVVHLVFRKDDFDADLEANKKAVREANSGLDGVEWHLAGTRRLEKVDSVEQFWKLPTEDLVDWMLGNYQTEALRHLGDSDNLVSKAQSHFATLGAAAAPYLKFVNHRPHELHRHPDFVFGPDLKSSDLIAQHTRIEKVEKAETGLRHMVFIYRERRCFGVNEMQIFSSCEPQTRYHPQYLNHRDPNYFNWRRFENIGKTEMLMEASLALFPAKVFSMVGDSYRFTARRGGKPETFNCGQPDEYRRLAGMQEVVTQLEEAVEKALRQIEANEYKNVSYHAYEKIDAELLTLRESDPLRAQLVKRKELLDSFNETFVTRVYGPKYNVFSGDGAEIQA